MNPNTSTKQQFYSIYLDRLRELYSGERQISDSLQKFLDMFPSHDLRRIVDDKMRRADKHLKQLKGLFSGLNESEEGVFSEAMGSMLQECDYLRQKRLPPIVKEAAFITTLQKILHYQIAGYGGLRAFAKHLNLEEHYAVMDEILKDKSRTDKELTKAAEGDYFTKGINEEASM